MAQRPVFAPDGEGHVSALNVAFEWHAGMSSSQRRKSVRALHEAAAKTGLCPILEVSTKSDDSLGRSLSALSLSVMLRGKSGMPVECAFQGSKVFARGGPYCDLYSAVALSAKRDPRLRESGVLTAFDLMGDRWPLSPATAFYDWLYLQALVQHPQLSSQLHHYAGFTDIEFNPKRSINSQARSCALYVSLTHSGIGVPELLGDRPRFVQLLTPVSCRKSSDLPLFG